MKTAGLISIFLIGAGVLLVLLQLWFTPFDPALFMKMLITLGIFLFLTVAVALIRREYIAEDELKKDKFLD